MMLDITGWDDRITLSGDEDGGVGLGCSACRDGGRPLAYLGWSDPYGSDGAAAVKADTVIELLAVGTDHVRLHHAQQLRSVTQGWGVTPCRDRASTAGEVPRRSAGFKSPGRAALVTGCSRPPKSSRGVIVTPSYHLP